jgi:hypothetical protein
MDMAAMLDLSGEDAFWTGQTKEDEPAANPWDLGKKPFEAAKAKDGGAVKGKPGPIDNSGRLTQRLVNANKQDEVRMILSEAYQSLGEWRMEMMGGNPATLRKALAAIKRLNKLIRRAQRKIADLNKEDGLRAKQKRAEKQRQEFRVKEIKADLYRKMAERKKREKGYLRDAYFRDDNGPRLPGALSPAALEAKMLALADAMAAATAPAPAAAEAIAPEAGTGTVSSGGGETGGAEAAPEAVAE